MDSTQIFAAIAQLEDPALHEEVFGLLEAARNFSRDCAPAAQYETSFMLQVTTHLFKYSPECIAWFAALGVAVSPP
jgi:hypothetical protein